MELSDGIRHATLLPEKVKWRQRWSGYSGQVNTQYFRPGIQPRPLAKVSTSTELLLGLTFLEHKKCAYNVTLWRIGLAIVAEETQ